MSNSTTGSAAALGAWFTEGREADEFEREEILNDLHQFTAYGVSDATTIITTPNGRALVERQEQEKFPEYPLITFEYVRHGRWGKTTFWFNFSSVKFLFDALAAAPEKCGDFNELFVNEGPVS